MKKLILTAAIASTLSGCAAIHAVAQPGPADLSGIGVGTSRAVIISKLGAPNVAETTPAGFKQDIFEFQSGANQATKTRALLYLAGDFFTLFLSEIVFLPIEIVYGKAAECTGVATYDKDLITTNWQLFKKSAGDQQMGC